jgi:hypothetical protein
MKKRYFLEESCFYALLVSMIAQSLPGNNYTVAVYRQVYRRCIFRMDEKRAILREAGKMRGASRRLYKNRIDKVRNMTARLPRPRFPERHELQPCPLPGKHSIECADGCDLLLIDRIPIELSPTQYRIVRRLLEEGGRVVYDEELEQFASNVSRHIDDLRERLKNSGIAVIRAVKIGYLIGDEKEEEEVLA